MMDAIKLVKRPHGIGMSPARYHSLTDARQASNCLSHNRGGLGKGLEHALADVHHRYGLQAGPGLYVGLTREAAMIPSALGCAQA